MKLILLVTNRGVILLILSFAMLPVSAVASLLEDDFDSYSTGEPPVPPWMEDYTDCKRSRSFC